MTIRFLLLAGLVASSTIASADDKAPVTLSGQGDKPVEVRDATGEITEVIGQKDLTLNQIPADAAAREKMYREQQAERANALTAQREQVEAEQAAAEAEATKIAEDAAATEAAAAAKKAEEEFDPTPRKIRRNTVRGTRYISREPVDPALRTPENSGLRVITTQPAPAASDTGQTWPPPRPTDQLKHDDPLPPYKPD